MQPNIIPLESIQIATPCRADWNAMQKVQGADCIRFCPGCGKNVYDVSGMTRAQATHLIAAKEGNLCLRLHRRQDGTIITSDCPVGKAASHKRKYANQMFAAVAGMGAATLSVLCLFIHRLAAPPALKPPQNAVLGQNLPEAFKTQKPQESVLPIPRPEVPRFSSGEGAIVTNSPSEIPSFHDDSQVNDSQVTITMGAPPPMPSSDTGTFPGST